MDPRCRELDHPGAGHDLAPLGEAVADHQPPAGLVEQRGVSIEMRAALGLQGQHLARRQAAQLVEVERSDLGAASTSWTILSMAYSSCAH